MNETTAAAGQMQRAIRKWDGDVYHGHEPEAWADLRLRAIEQDSIQRELVAALGMIADRGCQGSTLCGWVCEQMKPDPETGEIADRACDPCIARAALSRVRASGEAT